VRVDPTGIHIRIPEFFMARKGCCSQLNRGFRF
jgi:hypothetical protein